MPPASGPLPRRSLPGSAIVPDVTKELAALRKRVAGKPEKHFPNTFAAIFASGLEVATELTSAQAFAPLPSHLAWPPRPYADARREALALVLAPTLETIAAAPLDTLASAEAMARHTQHGLLPAVNAARGLVEALRVASLANRVHTSSNRGYPVEVFFVPGVRHAHLDVRASTSLRHLVCAAAPDDYDRALAEARILRDAFGLPAAYDPHDHAAAREELQRRFHRAFFAFVFPDATLASEEVAACRAAGLPPPLELLASVATLDDVREVLASRELRFAGSYVHDLAAALPPADALTFFEDLLPALLKKPRYEPLRKTPPRELMCALATLELDATWAFLARHASDPIVGATVLELFRAHPERGAALEAASKGRGKLAAAAERVLGVADASVPLAAKGTYPDFLHTRPWLAKPKRSDDVVLKGLALLGAERGFVDRTHLPEAPPSGPPLSAKAREALFADVKRSENVWVQQAWQIEGHEKHAVTHEELAQLATFENLFVDDEALFVAAIGLDAIAYFQRDWSRHLDYEGGAETFRAAMALVSPRMAIAMARVAAKKSWRGPALEWFRRHAEVVVPGLLPPALGADTKLRRTCEDVLLHLRDHGEAETIREAARALGEAAAEAVERLLARDPLLTPAKPPKRPSYLRVEALPSPCTVVGERLPDAAVEGLLDLLSLGHPEEPHAGVRVLAADPRLDAASLALFARELFEQWVLGDAPGKDEWMLRACVAFPDDANTARLGAFAREQARKNAAKAERVCRALAALGSDHALTILELVALTTRYGALAELALALHESVATARGMDADELADRTLPDAGLDASGRRTLRRGDTTWQTQLRPDLKLHVRENDAAPWRTAVPRRKGADLDALREDFATLRADVQLAVDVARRRFERALRDERRWRGDTFARHVLAHPVARTLACTLLWESIADANAPVAFRVAEDGSLADLEDSELALDPEGFVRLAHPARGIDDTWSDRFADYGITQAFEQLGRSVGVAKDRASHLVALLPKTDVAPRRLLGILEPRGWVRVDRGVASRWTRRVATVELQWLFDPEVLVADLSYVSKVTSAALLVGEVAASTPALEALGEVAVFELLRDLEALRG